MTLRVLVACEESQTVCKAFRALGHEAYSCDIQDCSGGHPEWHVMGDCTPLLDGDCTFETADGSRHGIDGEWDLLICHPPCTYMSKAGARWMYAGGVLNQERLALAMQAKAFFFRCYNAKCKHVAVENPVPLKIVELPPPHALCSLSSTASHTARRPVSGSGDCPPLSRQPSCRTTNPICQATLAARRRGRSTPSVWQETPRRRARPSRVSPGQWHRSGRNILNNSKQNHYGKEDNNTRRAKAL